MKTYKIILYVYPHFECPFQNKVIVNETITNDFPTACEIAEKLKSLFKPETDIMVAIHEIKKEEEGVSVFNSRL